MKTAPGEGRCARGKSGAKRGGGRGPRASLLLPAKGGSGRGSARAARYPTGMDEFVARARTRRARGLRALFPGGRLGPAGARWRRRPRRGGGGPGGAGRSLRRPAVVSAVALFATHDGCHTWRVAVSQTDAHHNCSILSPIVPLSLLPRVASNARKSGRALSPPHLPQRRHEKTRARLLVGHIDDAPVRGHGRASLTAATWAAAARKTRARRSRSP